VSTQDTENVVAYVDGRLRYDELAVALLVSVRSSLDGDAHSLRQLEPERLPIAASDIQGFDRNAKPQKDLRHHAA
jgi:hypothetical protein